LASADPNIVFDCPECDECVSVSSDKVGNQIHCPHCADPIHVPSPMSVTDKLVAGMIDDDEFDHPGTLEIDGISNVSDDGSSWHIKCHICDSVLLVSQQQVGSKVKCNDCYSMLTVHAKKQAKVVDGLNDGSDLEVIDDGDSASRPFAMSDDSEELSLMPEIELSPEITNAQKEPIALMEPVNVAKTASPMFGLGAPESAAEVDEDDDSDEMIEMLDVPPEQLNAPESPLVEPTQLPRMPRKGKQAPSIPVVNDSEEEAPIRVHAKRRPKKPSSEQQSRPRSPRQFAFDESSPGDVLDKAVNILKSPSVWIWASVAIALMAIGGAVWQWLQPYPHRVDADLTTSQRILGWGTGLLFGQAVFFVGYTILLFVGGVIFRETAQGKTEVESIAATDAANFTSTMMLFGFSMFIAALPCMFFGYMFVSLPFQFFFAGILLFSAWKNQSAFSIVSGTVFTSFSKNSASWKTWLMGASIAAAGGIVGGMLMEVYLPIISVFTSIAGAIVVGFATLLYAAITGWHCGCAVENLQSD